MSRNNTASPHDGAYKQLFSHPRMVEDLLKDFVLQKWVAELDFNTLERYPGSFVSDDLQQRHEDVVWRIQHKGQWCYVYLLIEFQSQVDPWMALRMLVYTGLLYQDLVKSQAVKAGESLPPVFPLVLYNGLGNWNASQEVSGLIAPHVPELSDYTPSQKYYILNVSTIPADVLVQAQGLVGVLVRMERSQSPQHLRQSVQQLMTRLKEPDCLSLRRAFTAWIKHILLQRLVPREPIPEVRDLQEVDAMLAERVSQWTEKSGQKSGNRKAWKKAARKDFWKDVKKDVKKDAEKHKLPLWSDCCAGASVLALLSRFATRSCRHHPHSLNSGWTAFWTLPLWTTCSRLKADALASFESPDQEPALKARTRHATAPALFPFN